MSLANILLVPGMGDEFGSLIRAAFGASEPGVWYRPDDLRTQWTTDAATVQVAAVGDTVGYALDLSRGAKIPADAGSHAYQATASKRPLFARVPARGRVNELLATDTLSTQSYTPTAAQRTLSFVGTGTVTLSGSSTAGPLVGTGVNDRVSLTFTPTAALLTLTVSGSVTLAQVQLGAAFDNYQRVGTGAFDVTESGQQTLTGWLFDGVDDNLETNTIDLTTTDEMTVAAGHRRANTTATELLLEHSASSSGSNGSFAIIHGSGGANQWRSRGTTLVDLNKSVTPTGNIVITGVSKISTPTTTLRINGVQEALSVSSQGTGTFLSHKTYYGSRGGTSFFYTGYLFGLMFRGATSALPLLQRIEKYIGTKTGKNL